MDNYMVLLFIFGLVAVVFGTLAFMIPYLVKKGINISGILDNTSSALDTAGIVINGVQGIFPEAEGLALVDKIIGYAQKATEAAEQLYKASKIAADERKQKATEIIYDCLTVAEIEVTDDVKKIVDGLVEAAVFALPKTGVKTE